MTKKDMVDKFAELGYTKKDSRTIISDFEDFLRSLILQGETVSLRGVGVFRLRMASEKRIPNSVNPDKKVSPPHPIVKFTPCQQLRSDVARGVRR